MRSLLMIGLAIGSCLLGGCTPSANKGKLEGTKWVSLTQSVQGPVQPEGFFKLEFGVDGKFRHSYGAKEYAGKYSLSERDLVTFYYEETIGKGRKHVRTVFVKGDEMELSEPGGTSYKFRKEP